MFVLVSFDISSNKVRYRAVKALKGFGVRVQKSVFECAGLTEQKYLQTKDRLDGLIDRRTDSVRYYLLCRGCIGNVEWSGTGAGPVEKSFEAP